MQILIDTDTESRDGMILAARTLMLLAGVESITLAETGAAPPPPADVPVGTDELDPSKVFGGAARPLEQSVPPAPQTPPAPPAGNAPAAAGASAPVVAPPAATTPSSQTAPAAGERDKAGIPWDARVHSETKKKNADGTWRFRRNLDEAVKKAVMDELRALYSPQQQIQGTVPPPPPVTAAPPVVPPPPAATVTPPPPPANPPAAAAPVSVPPPPAVGVSDQSQPAVLPPPVTSFRDLMQKVNVALATGKLTQDNLQEACKAAGAEGVTALAAQPMLVPTVDQYLTRWLAA